MITNPAESPDQMARRWRAEAALDWQPVNLSIFRELSTFNIKDGFPVRRVTAATIKRAKDILDSAQSNPEQAIGTISQFSSMLSLSEDDVRHWLSYNNAEDLGNGLFHVRFKTFS